jgi:small-conductance mechanosensitive channel
MPGNSEHLAQAAHAKHDSALQRAQEALRRLDRAGQPITFSSVAQAACVHRSWLYRQPELRAQIDRLRANQQPRSQRQVPVAQRASTQSLRERVETLRQETARLRKDNQTLRDYISRVLGAQRQAACTTPYLQPPATLLDDMSTTRRPLP